jgi:hypothetical protein
VSGTAATVGDETITIGQVQRTGERLLVPVRVQNRTGHKLPTGFPSRRAWVRLEVQDADGQVLFCSGGFDQAGRITDTAGKVLDSELPAGPVQPHHGRITNSSEVQIYESVMADKDNQVTFTLLRGARYLKDNRLLPRGWKSEHPDAPATAPVGIQGDGFRDGEDSIVYDLPIAADGPLTIHASLLYQSIGVRHVNEVFQFDTPEVAMFKRMYDAADRAPETLGSDIKSIETGN